MRKIVILSVLMLACISTCMAQELFPRYTVVDILPTLVSGGENTLNEKVKTYEKENAYINGAARIDFLILPNGTIGDVQVNDATSEEAASAGFMFVANLPLFTAGKLNGEPVRTWRHITFRFGVPPKEDKRIAVSVEREVNAPSLNPNVAVAAIDDDLSLWTEDELPSFPGGNRAVNRFLSENLTYPTDCINNKIQGRVIINFDVEVDGSLSNIEVIRSVHPSLDREGIRVIQLMPRWFPGIHKGKFARVKYTLPITFKL